MATNSAEYMREWRKRNAERCRAYGRTRWGRIREKKLADPVYWFNSYRSNARRKGRSFTLPFALFKDLVTDRCYWCGAAPNPLNGVDRTNNIRGYEEGNVVSCCAQCNMAKREQAPSDFLLWAARLHDWQSQERTTV